MLIDFREREKERERERERERDMDVREQHPLVASYPHRAREQTRHLGMCPDGDWTYLLLVYRMVLQPTQPPSQGSLLDFAMQINLFHALCIQLAFIWSPGLILYFYCHLISVVIKIYLEICTLRVAILNNLYLGIYLKYILAGFDLSK